MYLCVGLSISASFWPFLLNYRTVPAILYMYIVFHFICTSYYVKYDTYIISYFVYKIFVGGLTINKYLTLIYALQSGLGKTFLKVVFRRRLNCSSIWGLMGKSSFGWSRNKTIYLILRRHLLVCTESRTEIYIYHHTFMTYHRVGL
jgi:hypothetical protein